VWRRFHAEAPLPPPRDVLGSPGQGLEDRVTRVSQFEPRRRGRRRHGSEPAPPAQALLGLLVAVAGSLAVWVLVAALVYGLLV
jgi:hypothetical protein